VFQHLDHNLGRNTLGLAVSLGKKDDLAYLKELKHDHDVEQNLVEVLDLSE
jgi:hypothetical protein